ncbi:MULTISPECIES: hemerythrin domain-containing protein [Bacillaceae]|uniref:hemerythrin domain-containing protein n=1 Tax=Bacillaceae TaxID=186817 RepID=UPI0027E119DD|nr:MULTISPECIES: hemerythrin domain-containing protein [Bacillaceae]MDR6124396.1 regulator of cell morphogenesis and NO signaling [Bacillus sp. SLBN-46]WML56984.1 hemerythrin domain-containing protein [Neobacillus sp. PS2-9]
MSGCMSGFGGMPQAELSEGLKQLKSEHPPLLEQLEKLYTLTQNIDQELNVEEDFIELIEQVKAFKAALDPHSEREEGVLFPMMGTYIGTTSGPIAVMEYEHDQAKTNIGSFLTNAEVTEASTEEKKRLAELIQNAYFILTEHFSKEENVLFPMAERMLTDEEKAELYKRIQEIK